VRGRKKMFQELCFFTTSFPFKTKDVRKPDPQVCNIQRGGLVNRESTADKKAWQIPFITQICNIHLNFTAASMTKRFD